MNQKRTLVLSLAALFAAGLALAPASAEAQYRPARGQHSNYRRTTNVRDLVIRAERESNDFRAWFERSAGRRDNDFKRDVQRLDEAMERLRDKATDDRRGAGRTELENALRWAREVDREIGRFGNRNRNREWNDLQRTLRELARFYNVRAF